MFFLYGNVEFIDIIMYFVADRKIVAEESVSAQSSYRTGLQITARPAAHLYTATGTLNKIVLQFEVKSPYVKIYDLLKFAVSL